MTNKLHLVLSVVVGGLAIHGAITACGKVSSSANDAGRMDDARADAPGPSDGGVPTGTIMAYGGLTIPVGWIVCDGTAVSRTTYASLFGAIGINFGGGDGINTFNLPDLRGRFLRGVDGGAGHDPDAASRTASSSGGPSGDAVGTLQPHAFASHRHTLTDPGHSHMAPTTSGIAGSTEVAVPTSQGFDYVGAAPVSTSTTGITEAAAGGAETRPTNVAVQYVIKL